MLESAQELLEKVKPYLVQVDDFCKEYELIDKVQADHCGLKCSTKEVYESQRKLFEYTSRFVYQSIISQRRISIIGLGNGLTSAIGEYNYLELSDQKPDGTQKDRFDHCEVVPVGISYDELIAFLKERGVILKETVKLHHTTYDTVLPSGFIIKFSREMLVDKIKREEMF